MQADRWDEHSGRGRHSSWSPIFGRCQFLTGGMYFTAIPAASSGLGSGRMRKLVVFKSEGNVLEGTYLTKYTDDPGRKLLG